MKNGSITHKRAGIMNTKALFGSILLFLIQSAGFAQEKAVTEASSSLLYNPLFIGLLAVIIILLVVIMVLADVLKAAAHHKRELERKKKQGLSASGQGLAVLILIAASSGTLSAQTVAQQAAEQSSYGGLGAFIFYLMLSIIAFELFVAWMLYKTAMQLLGVEERKRQKAEAKAKTAVKEPSFIEKLNASVAIEKETDIMLDHNYDGIQELDNDLPPWWKYGFYLTIVISVIYLIHYHVINTGKLQQAEYEDQLAQAKLDAEEYRKKASNLVDENNATLLSDKESLTSGENIYMDNCAACHGKAGQGGGGPNLTDDYWLHSGGIKDIFKTIKFGWPEKGMKAWQQDLSAKQIHEVSSYIKSLHGSNPANPKEAQGELYKEEAIVADSSQVVVKDTTQLVHN